MGVEEKSRGGAETGGTTTSLVCESGMRELARARGTSRGAGATTVGAIESPARLLSGETLGAGATGAEVSAAAFLVLTWETSGAGAMALAARSFSLRFAGMFNSGVGGMA